MIKQKKKTRLKIVKQTRKKQKEREWGENKAKFERKRKRN